MARYSVILTGGAPWGFRLKGDELGGYFTISKVSAYPKPKLTTLYQMSKLNYTAIAYTNSLT